jgi:hypothetical protein
MTICWINQMRIWMMMLAKLPKARTLRRIDHAYYPQVFQYLHSAGWGLEGFVLLGLVGLLTIFLLSRKSFDSQLPPGTTAWPIIGNLHQIGQQNQHHVLWEMSKKYGPVMRLWLGSHLLVVVSSAQAAAEFMKVQDKAWASRPPSIAMEIFSYNYRDIVWAPYGNHWRHVRKISLELLSLSQAP